MKPLILATSNLGKIQEFDMLLSPMACIPQAAFGVTTPEETGLSFVENAIIKARFASKMTNHPALADDSGLSVHALQGKPGIYSARFGGEHTSWMEKMALLLGQLQDVPESQRQAFFYCAVVIVQHAEDPTPIIATGQLDGLIAPQAMGDHGHGYDPILYLPQYQCTVGQLPISIKNTISHRAQALDKLKKMALSFFSQ